MSLSRLEAPVWQRRHDDGPDVLAVWKTELDCGCRCWVGSTDANETGVVSEACDATGHRELVMYFRRLWSDLQHRPGWADIEAERLLKKAEGEFYARHDRGQA